MAYQDFFSGLQADYTAEKAAVDVKSQGAADALADVGVQLKTQYNQGVIDGKAMIQLPVSTDPAVIYTQAQMDQAVINGKQQQKDQDDQATQAQIADLTSKMAALQSQVDAFPATQAAAVKDVQDKADQEIADLKASFETMKTEIEAAESKVDAKLS